MRVSSEQDWKLLNATTSPQAMRLIDLAEDWADAAEVPLDAGLGHNPYTALMLVLPDLFGDLGFGPADLDKLGTALMLLVVYWQPIAENPEAFFEKMTLIERAYLDSVTRSWVQAQVQMETAQVQAREFAEANSAR